MAKKIHLDPEVIEKGLKPESTDQERLKAFRSAGIPSYVIRDVADVELSTYQNWLSGATKPRAKTQRVLDDIRSSLVIMSFGGLPYERAAMVLRSRTDLPPYHRPMEIISEQPETVFEIARHAVDAWAQTQK